MNKEAEPVRLTLTVEEAAACLGIGRQSVYALLKTDRLRFLKIGRKIVIPRDAIRELLNG